MSAPRAALLIAALAVPAGAQDTAPRPAPPPSDAPTANVSDGVPAGRGRSYEPAYFERFGPRNALDMLVQVPGFEIRGGGGGRGLGQADENVLVNGERLSSKTDSARDQLSRIPVGNVVRIDIVDGTTLDIPGLSGQVANVITRRSGVSGQFNYNAQIRAYNADPALYGGEVSVTGSTGALDYTLALSNENNRFGNDGPTRVTGPTGALIEVQDAVLAGAFDRPQASAKFGYDFGGDTVANLNLTYARTYFNRLETEIVTPVAGPGRFRENIGTGGSPEYEISGDIEFALGPGRLKLIGLEAYDGDVDDFVLTDRFADDRPAIGSRFAQDGGSGERIARGEYGWRMWNVDWQLSAEAAFNRLDRVSSLFALDPFGEFVIVPFPQGSGGVREDRYEAILSASRQLTERLAVQASAGGEYSQIELTGATPNSRVFQRPKGAVSLTWRPDALLDVSAELRRSVGQLSFGDFLGRVFLDNDNQNAGNNELVPSQSWDLSVQVNRGLGEWGSTTLSVERRWISDIIDIVPLIGGGEARGNIDSARATEIEWNTTFRFDPLGWRGAQLQVEMEVEPTSLRDPLTGSIRAFSRQRDRLLDVDFRRDIPGGVWAYGGGLRYERVTPFFRLAEFGRRSEGPTFASVFIENKDVLGLTVTATLANVLGGRDEEFRAVFAGPRDTAPLLFVERQDRRIGPIVRLSVSGNF